ncbi:MAG: radical SAM protein [Candidatus Omnitrophica bacterium]|nr:radical SAM protein [Candidatus Omnitrophota bacterium]
MRIEIIEKNVDTILRPTGINLAPYVVNPYQGCAFACLFCYAQFSKAAQKETSEWGKYVKVKVNGLEILKKELQLKNPKKVLIGSTTEPFQPVEKKYGLTRGIIRILNQRKIKYVIMSRSLLLGEYIEELDRQLCAGIYFTVDVMPKLLKQKFEPYAVSAKKSIELVNKLINNNINTTAYFCPVMPFLHENLKEVNSLNIEVKAEFEIINFQMSGIRRIIQTIEQIYPEAAKKYKKMCLDKTFYNNVARDIKKDIKKIAGERFKDVKIHQHKYADYF